MVSKRFSLMAENEGLRQRLRRMDARLAALEEGQDRLAKEANESRSESRNLIERRTTALSEELQAEAHRLDTSIQSSYKSLYAKIDENAKQITELRERLDTLRDELRADLKAVIRGDDPGTNDDMKS